MTVKGRGQPRRKPLKRNRVLRLCTPETLVGDQNFVTDAVSGQDAERILTVTCTDKQGATRFTDVIKATDLGYTPPAKR